MSREINLIKMKRIILTSFVVFFCLSIGKSQSDNLSQLNTYWIGAKAMMQGGNNILKIQVNQTSIDYLDRIVPKISTEGIKGGVNEITAILFEKKNIKFLDPEFRSNLFTKCNNLKQLLQNKSDAITISTTIFDLGTFIYNFIETAYPQACETNNTGKIVIINTSKWPCDVMLNDNLLTRVQGNTQSESFVLPAGDNQKLFAKEAIKFFPKEKTYPISIATCSTRKYSIPN